MIYSSVEKIIDKFSWDGEDDKLGSFKILFVILIFHDTLVKPKRYYFFHGCCIKYIKNLNSGRFIFRLCIIQYIYIILTKIFFFSSRADMVVKLTHEQLRIVNHNVQPGEVIKIIAFAGQSLNFINFLNVSLTKKKK